MVHWKSFGSYHKSNRTARMKEKKKFLVFGGYVECRDGDVHYVPSYRVAELYGLSPRMPNVRLACFDVPETYLPYDDSWIRLYPRSDGNYKNMREEMDEDE